MKNMPSVLLPHISRKKGSLPFSALSICFPFHIFSKAPSFVRHGQQETRSRIWCEATREGSTSKKKTTSIIDSRQHGNSPTGQHSTVSKHQNCTVSAQGNIMMKSLCLSLLMLLAPCDAFTLNSSPRTSRSSSHVLNVKRDILKMPTDTPMVPYKVSLKISFLGIVCLKSTISLTNTSRIFL
jgi:outer membrane protease